MVAVDDGNTYACVSARTFFETPIARLCIRLAGLKCLEEDFSGVRALVKPPRRSPSTIEASQSLRASFDTPSRWTKNDLSIHKNLTNKRDNADQKTKESH